MQTNLPIGVLPPTTEATEARSFLDPHGLDGLKAASANSPHDPATLLRTWSGIKEIMRPGALDALTKELIYVAVSATNQCGYCIASHTAGARKAGMTDAMFAEVMAVVGMANETNRLASGYQVEVDARFKV